MVRKKTRRSLTSANNVFGLRPRLGRANRKGKGRRRCRSSSRAERGKRDIPTTTKNNTSSSSDLWRVRARPLSVRFRPCAAAAAAAIAKHLMNSKRILHNLEQSATLSLSGQPRRVLAYNYSSLMHMRCGNPTCQSLFRGKADGDDERLSPRTTIRLCRFYSAKAAKVK